MKIITVGNLDNFIKLVITKSSKKNKKIDFQVHFSCEGIPGNFWKKALNRVRDGGDYTMYLDLCTNVVN